VASPAEAERLGLFAADAISFEPIAFEPERGGLFRPISLAEAPLAPIELAAFSPSDAGLPKTAAGDTIPGNATTPFTLAIGGSETGFVNFPGDDDWFRVELVAGQSYVFTLTGSTGGGGPALEDPYLQLYNSSGLLIAIDDDAGPVRDSELRFTVVQSGTYYINARAWEPDTGATLTGGYQLAVNFGAPQNPLDTIDLRFSAAPHIDVYFATNGQTFAESTASRSWLPSEIDAAMNALDTFADVTNLTFSQADSPVGAEFILFIAELDQNTLGLAYRTGGVSYAEFDDDASWWTPDTLQPGGVGWVTLIHEFGHALGLGHPHDGTIGPNNHEPDDEIMQGVIDEFDSFGTFLMNQGVFTTMGYNDGWTSVFPSVTFDFGNQATPMALDVALLQIKYGADMSANFGDSTYTLPTSNTAGTFFSSIWDVDGVDTIQAGSSTSATIDLRSASLLNEIGGGGFVSSHSGVRGGFTIAAGAVIENARGGGGSDILVGNNIANRLEGQANGDNLQGNGGNDTLVGGADADTLDGGDGIDTSVYSIASTSASWFRLPSGQWSVNATVDGTDNMVRVEFLDFTDRDVFLDRAARTFSGDGGSDILWRNANGATVIWAMNSETVAGAGSTSVQVGPVWSISDTGDFNGDGRDDILWRHTSGQTVIWQMNGESISQAGATSVQVGNVWSVQGIGDFNLDGRDDILWRNTNGQTVIWQMNGASVGQAGATSSQVDNAWQVAGIGDFNGDGRDDFVWRHDNGLTAIWHMNGTNVASSGLTSLSAGLEWDIAGVGDFNGDGRDDLLWRNTNGATVIWQMNETSAQGASASVQVNNEWRIAAVGDYNGDGRDDILWRHDNGLTVLWEMDGASVIDASVTSVQVGNDWDIA
jgi:hypothetical protein